MPLPGSLVVKNGSPAWRNESCDIPLPRSFTTKQTESGERDTDKLTGAPAELASIPFFTRAIIACSIACPGP